MQSKPPAPATTTKASPDPRKGTLTRALTWIRQRRRTAATHLLRGLCYGIGTGLAGLAFWWLEQHL
ncbi:hypothetical protein ACVB8X_07005 [Streptomyces sp. NRAIS4]